MRILIVHSGNATSGLSSQYTFVYEQGEALKKVGVEISYFAVLGKGILGYARAYCKLYRKIIDFNPDIIHAHYGLCGLLCVLQRRIPVVVTYHGSDINNPNVFRWSKIAMLLSHWNIFVSNNGILKVRAKCHNYSLLPCGIPLTDEQCTAKTDARHMMRLDPSAKIILFAGAFDNPIKDVLLAQKAINILCKNGEHIQLLELKGYTRTQVNLLLCAADVFLMTSKMEGSPQVIKEAMACGCPIVSVNVGDVAERIGEIDGCYITPTRTAEDIASCIVKALSFDGRTKGRQYVIDEGLDNRCVAKKLLDIYITILKKNGYKK